jgi:hypothetical protein
MKALKWSAWISGGIGVVLLLLAAISIIFRIHPMGNQIASYFHAANSFFLLTIALFIFLYKCDCKK